MEPLEAARARFDVLPAEDEKGRAVLRKVMAARSCHLKNGEWFFHRLDGTEGGPYKDAPHAMGEAERYYGTYGMTRSDL